MTKKKTATKKKSKTTSKNTTKKKSVKKDTKKSKPKEEEKETAKKEVKAELSLIEQNQPEINIGLVGHVDHGKTTLVSKLSGKWTDEHSEEIKRGITIRLGYANTIFYKCLKCKPNCFVTSATCPKCKSDCKPIRKVSFIDAPGHETLMATMLSGAAIMDGALLLIAANEECPQPQTKEHLMALDIIGVKNIIIIQNKIDLVSEEEALKNYEQIKAFVKGTSAENAPIIPVSAQHNVNISVLIDAIEDVIKTPKRDLKKEPLMSVARSFDVNRPGSKIDSLKGGVLGGALKQGKFSIGDEIEIRPGLRNEKEGKVIYDSIITKIIGLNTGSKAVDSITPGGSVGVLTGLDPSIVKSDSLVGNAVGIKGKLPDVWDEFELETHLLERVVGVKDELLVDPIREREILMLNVNSSATVGIVDKISKGKFHAMLKIPVCCTKKDRITISRKLGDRWRLIGWGEIK
ncbi:MAG: translation initiation factor IF-2 subunit gamma [Nanoarchaeota archaeon]|nr:translation initiation factor IF-2 subunit gamma [Nanoarchaeota archaeon]MCG2719041.1 translation initiation factor IF-2 subunit gamma [Nanoarchaeota archaeon]